MRNKIKHSFVIILLFKSVFLTAQDINFGLRVNQISKQEKDLFITKINTGTSDVILNSYDAELIGEKINLKNTFQRINVGLYVLQMNYTSTADYSSIPKTITSNGTQTGLGYSLRYSIGKIYYFNKLTFRFGIEMSGRYFTPGVMAFTTEYFDTTNVKYQTYKASTTYSPYYIFGTTMLSGIHYNFYKTLSVGIEFGNSVYYNIKNGTEVYYNELYNASGTLLETQTTSTQDNTSGLYISYLRSSVSIYYSF